MIEGNYPYIKIGRVVINLTGLCSITCRGNDVVFDFIDRVSTISYSDDKVSEMDDDIESVWNFIKVEDFPIC